MGAAAWLESGLAELARKPWRLGLACAALSWLMHPQWGLRHDARLYAALCQHEADGRFAGDLFFFGATQARFTLLPRLLGPAVVRLDPAAVFGILTAAGSSLYCIAAARLARRLLGETALAAAACAALTLLDVWVGGETIFRAHEPFFTPRLPAFALGLVALERLLAGRPVPAALAALGATALHPLIGFPVWLAGAGAWLAGRPRLGAAAVALGALGLAAVAGFGGAVLKPMDGEWLGVVLTGQSYCDPRAWKPATWLRFGLGVGASVTWAWRLGPGPARNLLIGSAVVAVAGVVVAVVAVYAEVAILFQGQAFRWLWPLEVLAWPAILTVGWAELRCPKPAARLGGAALWAGWDAATCYWSGPAGVPELLALGAVAAAVLGRFRAAVAAFAAAHLMRAALGWDHIYAFLVGLPPLTLVLNIISAALPGLILCAGLVWGAWVGRMPGRRAAVTIAAAGLVGLAIPATGTAPAHAHEESFDFVRRSMPVKTLSRPRVYWPDLPLRRLWFGAGLVCYFNEDQRAGTTFDRSMALELDRRSRLTREYVGDPSARTLATLLAEPCLDAVVVGQPIPGATADATDGVVWVYLAPRRSQGGD